MRKSKVCAYVFKGKSIHLCKRDGEGLSFFVSFFVYISTVKGMLTFRILMYKMCISRSKFERFDLNVKAYDQQ